MSALEKEVLEKFNQLDPEAQERVRRVITLSNQPMNETGRALAELLEFSAYLREKAHKQGLSQTPSVQEMLDEIRGNNE